MSGHMLTRRWWVACVACCRFDAPHQRIHRCIDFLMAIFNMVLQANLPAGHHTASSRTLTPHHIDLFRRRVEARMTWHNLA
jgi:hypothetical protein